MPSPTLLIVDDEPVRRLALRVRLEDFGFKVLEAHDGPDALELITALPVDLMLVELKLPALDGVSVLENLHRQGKTLPTIIMTPYDAIDSALKATDLGVKDYLATPVDPEALLLKIREILNLREIDQIRASRTEGLNQAFDFQAFLGQSQPMLALKEMIALTAPSECTVLITGEPGVGKELVAQTIFNNSARKGHPFITVTCPALPDTLLESDLFGHEKGAFSGADRRKQGRFELANQGTLFLDEIGEMAVTTQARLLRALDNHAVERMGGSKPVKSDVRLLAATSLDLELEIENQRFRADLYQRLNVVRIHVPNLRDRGPEDIRILSEHFLQIAANRYDRDRMAYSSKAMKAMQTCPWPGNVRELINAVERAVILSGGSIVELDDLPLTVQNWSQTRDHWDVGQRGIRPGMTIKEVEAELISRTLADTGGNRSRAAAILGITRQTLLNKIKEYDLYS